jgi:transcriptional regulator with XRE-family HTH domain
MSKNIVPDIHKKIGKKIKKARNAAGLSLEDVSKKTGISVSHLSSLESGHRRLHIDALYAIAEAIGVNVADLLEYDDFDKSKIVDKHIASLLHDWGGNDRKKEAAILLREFRNLTSDEIHMLIETVKTFKK